MPTGDWSSPRIGRTKIKLAAEKDATKASDTLKEIKGQGAGFSSALSMAFNSLKDSEDMKFPRSRR